MVCDYLVHNNYICADIKGETYLLPYGQKIVQRRIGFKINKTGCIIWKGICEGKSIDEISGELMQIYEASDDEVMEIKKDVEEFVFMLSSCDAVKAEKICEYRKNTANIGPLKMVYQGPENVYNSYFSRFSGCEAAECTAVQNIKVYKQSQEDYFGDNSGDILIKNSEVIIKKKEDCYILSFGIMEYVKSMLVSEDGSNVEMYITDMEETEQLADEIFNALRFAFILFAQKKGMYMLHSASILYEGKAWLFSGHSGAGKSTHTNLWHENFGTEILNGDLNLIGKENGTWMVYGQPWCGTSGIASTKKYPLGGITLIKQSQTNEVEKYNPELSAYNVLQRLISPSWNKEQMSNNIDFALSVTDIVPVMELKCTKYAEAAFVMKEMIDSLQ